MDETQLLNIYTAYSNGTMSPQEKIEYEKDIQSGAINLPQGVSLSGQESPQAEVPTIDIGVFQAYQSGQMTPQERADFETDLNAGAFKLPEVVQEPQTQQPQEPGIIDKVGDVFTGNLRETEEINAIPDYGRMPELNSFSMASFKSALGDMMASPEESVQIIKANFPNTQVRQDEKGNFILRSSIDGQEYAIKPGFQVSDIPKAVAGVAAFTPAGTARTVGGQILGGAATQAAIEGTQAATGGQVDAAEIALAGGLGGAGALAGKAATGIKGALSPQAESAAQQAVRQAEQSGISPMTSDVIQPTTFAGKWAQSTSEKIPLVGTGGAREAQQETRVSAIKELFSDYGASDAVNVSDEVMQDLTKKRASELTKYSKLKGDVIQKLSASGEVPVQKTTETIDKEIASLQSLNTAGVEPIIKTLEDFKGAFQNQNMENVELLRKQLGEQLKAPDLASVRSIGEKSAANVYKSLRDDMGDFIKANGDKNDYTKWQVGNKRLAQMIGEIDQGTLKAVLKRGGATPEMVRRLLFSKKPSEVAMLYRNLSQDGRAKARTAIMQEVLEKSGGIENISTDRFLSELKRQSGPIKGFFRGDDLEAIKGLTKALEMTRRASDSSVAPPTGVQLSIPVGAAVLTDLMGGAGAGIATAGTVGGLSRVYESKPVRNLLLKLSKAKPGTEQKIIQSLINVAQAEKQKLQSEEE